jgi:hypothetical protein
MINWKENIAIAIVSCDRYSDLHQPFFYLFKKFWPDCPFKTYLFSNEKRFNQPGLNNILVGKDVSWSDNLISALNKIEEEYVFLWVDDLFLIDRVDTTRIISLFEWATARGINYLCLNALPSPDKNYNNDVGIVSPGSLYRASTVLTFWDKKVLLGLLKSRETAWQFEINGSIRSDKYDKFYATWVPAIKVINGVIKGKWRRSAVRRLNSLGVVPDLRARKKNSLFEEFIFFLKISRSIILRMFPSNFRRSIRRTFIKDK